MSKFKLCVRNFRGHIYIRVADESELKTAVAAINKYVASKAYDGFVLTVPLYISDNIYAFSVDEHADEHNFKYLLSVISKISEVQFLGFFQDGNFGRGDWYIGTEDEAIAECSIKKITDYIVANILSAQSNKADYKYCYSDPKTV